MRDEKYKKKVSYMFITEFGPALIKNVSVEIVPKMYMYIHVATREWEYFVIKSQKKKKKVRRSVLMMMMTK